MIQSYNIWPKKSMFLALASLMAFIYMLPAEAARPNDEKYSFQKSFWQQVGAEQAWDISTSTEAIIAIVDTGVDYTHPDLRDNIWKNSDEIPDNDIDDDANGFVDDIYGWNFVENNAVPMAAPNSGFGDNNTLSHGTAIAGLIGAIGNNGIGGTGLNWKVKIMPLRAIDSYGIGIYENIGKAISYAVNNGASAISISFVGDVYDEGVYEILRNAYERGVITVVAAGNSRQEDGDLDKKPLYPVCFDSDDQDNWILGVTSVGSDDRLSSFANFGSCVDLAAPGESLFSTEIPVSANNYTGFGGDWQGTSFSAPFVAGALAMVKGIRPDWTAHELIETLILTADDISGVNSDFVGQMGYGRLNVGRAVARAVQSRIAGYTDRVCYAQTARIYCYDIEADAKIYLADAKEKVAALDWLGKNYVAAIISGLAANRVDIYSGKGILVKSFQIKDKYSNISIFEKDGFLNFVIAKYDSALGRTRFTQYGINSAATSSFNLKGDWRKFQVVNDTLYAAALSNGRVVVATYDLSGKRLSQLIGPPASAIASVKAGHLWSKSGYEMVLLARDGAGYFKFIADSGNAASLKERLSYRPGGLLLVDKNLDGYQEIIAYSAAGGVFEVVTAKGKAIGSVSLPALR